MNLKSLFSLTIITTTVALTGCVKDKTPYRPKMVYKPIDLGKLRIKLTQQYRCLHYKLCDPSIAIKPRMIILHKTGTQNWHDAYNTFKSASLDNKPALKKYGALNVSTQFLVARKGRIYQLMPSDLMARHTVGLNYLAIGIQNAGDKNLTNAQAHADIYLIRMLKKQYPTIKYLIGHNESQCFRDTPLWKERLEDNAGDETGPDSDFMTRIRKQVKKLGLEGCPNN